MTHRFHLKPSLFLWGPARLIDKEPNLFAISLHRWHALAGEQFSDVFVPLPRSQRLWQCEGSKRLDDRPTVLVVFGACARASLETRPFFQVSATKEGTSPCWHFPGLPSTARRLNVNHGKDPLETFLLLWEDHAHVNGRRVLSLLDRTAPSPKFGRLAKPQSLHSRRYCVPCEQQSLADGIGVAVRFRKKTRRDVAPTHGVSSGGTSSSCWGNGTSTTTQVRPTTVYYRFNFEHQRSNGSWCRNRISQSKMSGNTQSV